MKPPHLPQLTLMTILLSLSFSTSLRGESRAELKERLANLEKNIARKQTLIAEQQERVSEAEKKAEEARVQAADVISVKQKIKDLDSSVHEKQLSLVGMEKELSRLENVGLAYRENFVPKLDLQVGQTIDDFTDSKGRKFGNATITEISNDGTVKFREGLIFGTLRPSDLPKKYTENAVLPPASTLGEDSRSVAIIKRRPTQGINPAVAVQLSQHTQVILLKDLAEAQSRDREMLAIEEAKQKMREAEMASQAAATSAKMSAIDHQIAGLRTQIQSLEQQISAINNRKSVAESAFNSARIKPDRFAHAKQMAEFDQAISTLSLQRAELQGRIDVLNSQRYR